MNTHELGKLYQNNKDILIQQLSAEVKSEWVIVVNANSAIFQLYHGENKLIFNEIMMRSTLY